MDKARSFRKICTFHQCINKKHYLMRIMGSIGIHHHDDIAGRRCKAFRERIALAFTRLPDNMDIGS